MAASIRRRHRAAAAVAAVLLLVGFTAVGCGGKGGSSKPRAVAVDQLGPDPFFAEAFGVDRRNTVSDAAGATYHGDEEGLYGGSLNKKDCDKARLVSFLTNPENERKARAWAGVQGIGVEGISRFVGELTPALLRHDLLVKNHGFREGAAWAFESLLEAGIAVLLDRFGQPVVKCNCGNPLAVPSHTPDEIDSHVFDNLPDADWQRDTDKRRPSKSGKRKPDARRPGVIKPGKTPRRIGRFVLLDFATGSGIGRPAGSDAQQDVTLPPPPPLPSAAPPPDTSAPADPAVVGTWRSPDYPGAQVRIASRGTDEFVGLLTSEVKVTDSCVLPEGKQIWRLSGGGAHYEGTVLFLNLDTCADQSPSPATWESQGQDTLRMCVEALAEQGCQTLERAKE